MARCSLLLFTLTSGLLAQQRMSLLDIVSVPGSPVTATLGHVQFYGHSGFGIRLGAPLTGATIPYRLSLPANPPPTGGGYLYSDGTHSSLNYVLEWRTPTGGGGGSYTFNLPLQESLGVVTCSRCMRNDSSAANLPSGSVDIGSTASWYNAVYAGTFQVSTGPTCPNSAWMSATNLFGGAFYVKNSSCVVAAGATQNGLYIQNTGSYRVQGETGPVVIDNNRNATVNNLTILGTCTGCPGGGGGGGGVVSVSAALPIQSSGGISPTISCPTCMRFDVTNLPYSGVNLGSNTQWFNEMFAGSFTVSIGFTCTAAARMSATALFGGSVIVRDAGCIPTVELSNQGLVLPQQTAASGTRYLCINTAGRVTSSASGCSGT